MHLARADGTATLLSNGLVLVAGGDFCEGDTCEGHGPTETAELYNPRTNTWSWAASMHEARVDHTATGIPKRPEGNGGDRTARSSGRHGDGGGNDDGSGTPKGSPFVLVAAGGTRTFPATNTSEIYSARDNIWTVAGLMNHLRVDHTAVLLGDQEEVLITGGAALVNGAPEFYSRTAELYDIESGTWRETTPMTVGRNDHTLTLLRNGSVLAVGGHRHPEEPQDSAELFNPDSETWMAIASSTGSNRAGHTANLLRDGRVLIAGGLAAPGTSTNTASLYRKGDGQDQR